jgi:hypothetical protein
MGGEGMVRLAACALALTIFAAGSAHAAATGETTDDSLKAIETARAAVSEALSKAPLGFRRILFVSAVPEGFAAYKPREDASFKSGEPLIIYAEPIGVAWKQDGDEFASKLTVDFEIKTPEGKVLAGQKGFGEFALEAREPPIDYMSHIKLDVSGAPTGSYVLGLTIHDANSGKSSSKDLPFEIK